MSAPYPIFLDLSQARILVVGGGAVATRKATLLVQSGAKPTIISPALTPELRELVTEHGLDWRARGYESADAAGCQLVIAATSRGGVNAQVAADARRGGAWVNVADDPESSTFHVPAVLREGEVSLALSTGGAAPLLARRLRERLARTAVTPGLGRAVQRLAEVRRRIHTRWPDDSDRRRRFWFSLITQEFLDSAIAGRDEEVDSRIEACLSQS